MIDSLLTSRLLSFELEGNSQLCLITFDQVIITKKTKSIKLVYIVELSRSQDKFEFESCSFSGHPQQLSKLFCNQTYVSELKFVVKVAVNFSYTSRHLLKLFVVFFRNFITVI